MNVTHFVGLFLWMGAILTTGCAQLQAPSYAADYETLDRLKTACPDPVAVSAVQPADPTQAVNNLSL